VGLLMEDYEMQISSRITLWVVVVVCLALLSAVAVTASTKTSVKHTKPISSVCPVMGTAIPDVSKAAGHSVYKGKTYYFCCPACKPQFDANPAKYVKAIKAKAAANCSTCTGVPKGACKGGVCPLPKSTKHVTTKATANHANKPK